MTAAQLIDKLKQYPPETPVLVDNETLSDRSFRRAEVEEHRVYHSRGGVFGQFVSEHLQGRNNLTAIVVR